MRFVPRSAVFGKTAEDVQAAQPQQAQRAPLRAVPQQQQAARPAQPSTQREQLLVQAVMKLKADRARIVNEANKKLGALAARVRQLEGALRGYMPVPPAPAYAAMPNAVPAAEQVVDMTPPPAQATTPDAERVQAAQDALFYGRGDSAFYEGGEND